MFSLELLHAESAKRIPDIEERPGQKGTELSRTPAELKSGDWVLKVVPWVGGRIISMVHLPSGIAHFPDVTFFLYMLEYLKQFLCSCHLRHFSLNLFFSLFHQ